MTAPRAIEQAVGPAEGIMLVFPSWLYHRVSPHEGERISIAFNARLTSFKVPEKGA